ALVLYEHAITLGTEVQQIWRRHLSGATVLFIMTRYLILLDQILVMISLSSIRSLEVGHCRTLTWLHAVTTSILIVVMSAVAAVRVYALWNRDLRLFALVMATGVLPALANLYFRSASTVYIIPTKLFSCQAAPTAMSAGAYTSLSIATRIVSIFSDGLVVVLTWVKTYRVFVLTRKIKLRTNYSTLILRDGTLYFLAVCVLNLIAIVYVMNIGANLLNDMIVNLSALLMARFLLNLRDQRHQNEDLSLPLTAYTDSLYPSKPSLSSVRFSPALVDSMGGLVGDEDEDDDEEGGDDQVDKKTTTENFEVISYGPRRPDSEEVWNAPPPPGLDSKEAHTQGVLVLGEKGATWA
ncbi:hypothetical protein C8Q74DRAFT_1207827, partial [Fomes fomentarius]